MADTTIKHDALKPWGWWMRTVSNPQGGIVIVDEQGRQWQSLRDAFWCGRLGMSRDNPRIMDENLELMLALLASRTRGIVPPIEQVHTLHGGNAAFFRWWTYWLQSTGLVSADHMTLRIPFDAHVTAEGASVIRMLLATRPAELAAVPIGPVAMATFGPPGSGTECDRDRFDAAEGRVRGLPFAVVREQIFGKPAISMLHRNPEDVIPLARTVWSMAFLDEASRDRMYLWMHNRLDRWTAWGELALRSREAALTQHLLALLVLDERIGSGPPAERGHAPAPLAITHRP